MIGGMQGWQFVIVVAVVLLLFGSRKLPDMARGLGQSLKIFKSETKGLVAGDEDKDGKGDAEAQPETEAKTQTPAADDQVKRDS